MYIIFGYFCQILGFVISNFYRIMITDYSFVKNCNIYEIRGSGIEFFEYCIIKIN